jgi:hypothetical protein
MSRHYGYVGGIPLLGDDVAAPAPSPVPAKRSLRDTLNSDPVSTVAALALTYHGYRRTGSLVWALLYGLAGKWFPIEAVPISIAMGFGQRKICKLEGDQ